jgi:hypothetical protein
LVTTCSFTTGYWRAMRRWWFLYLKRPTACWCMSNVPLRQLTFVWRWGRSLYGRILFVGVRYAALAFVIVYLFPVRPDKLARVVCGPKTRVHCIFHYRWRLGLKTLWRSWGPSLSYAQKVSMSFIIFEYFTQSTCSHLCDENVGYMGKKPADPCIPHRAYDSTALNLSISYVLLTRIIRGLCGISDHSCCTFLSRCSMYVASPHLPGGEPAI